MGKSRHFCLTGKKMPAWCMVTSYEVEGKSELHWEVIYMNAITGEFIR